jgi:hypothetical protein
MCEMDLKKKCIIPEKSIGPRELCVSIVIKVNLDPSLSLRMTNWYYLVILRTEGTKNLGFYLCSSVVNQSCYPVRFTHEKPFGTTGL